MSDLDAPSVSRFEAATDAEAATWLQKTGRTDGLPVVLPTPDRVEEMLLVASFAGYERDLVIADIGPNMGAATVEKIAINAVMAGCDPQALPVVLAVVAALGDPRMDTSEMQSTTHDVAPLAIVNGPVRDEVGLVSAFGALGSGHAANLTIGRAVRLCLINIGGGRPGVSDMALLGHPGKIAYCLAENEEESPFPPLHTSLGHDPGTSAVTVVGVGAPRAVLGFTNAEAAATAEVLRPAMCARPVTDPGVLGRSRVYAEAQRQKQPLLASDASPRRLASTAATIQKTTARPHGMTPTAAERMCVRARTVEPLTAGAHPRGLAAEVVAVSDYLELHAGRDPGLVNPPKYVLPAVRDIRLAPDSSSCKDLWFEFGDSRGRTWMTPTARSRLGVRPMWPPAWSRWPTLLDTAKSATSTPGSSTSTGHRGWPQTPSRLCRPSSANGQGPPARHP